MANPIGEQHALLDLLVDRLEDVGITYMISGSFASSIHGEPRMTRDIDVVIDATEGQLTDFASRFDTTNHYVTDPIEALRRRTMFTIVEIHTGWKVDLIIRKDRAFSREELNRRQEATIDGTPVHLVTVEDSILSKLEWAQASESDRQDRDVAGMIAANRLHLDLDYLRRWAVDLGVEERLEEHLSANDTQT